MAATEDAGVTQIDYLLVTHFHTDHMGGALQLADRLPVRYFVDHGTSPDLGRGQVAFDRYAVLRARAEHLDVSPGDVVPIAGLDVRIIASGGNDLREQLAGARGEATRIIEEARQAADAVRAETVNRAQQEAEDIVSRARSEAAAESGRALEAARLEVANLSIDLAEKVVEQSLDREAQLGLVESYLTELESSK